MKCQNFLKKINFHNKLIILISILISLFFVELLLYFDNKNFYEPIYFKKKIGGKIFKLSSVEISQSELSQFVFFGDSFMMGKKCGNKKSLPSLFSKDFKNKYGVINFGQPGLNAIQIYSNIKIFLENEEKPKKIIIGLYSNDIHMDKSYCDFINDIKKNNLFSKKDIEELELFCSKNKYIDKLTKPDWHKFGITQLINESIVKLLTIFKINKFNSRNKFYNDLRNLDSLENKLLRYSIIKISEILENYNVKSFLFFFPNAENLNLDSDISKSYNFISKKLSDNFNITVFNGYKFFNLNYNKSMTASLLDKHSDCRYYEIIHEYLKKNESFFRISNK